MQTLCLGAMPQTHGLCYRGRTLGTFKKTEHTHTKA